EDADAALARRAGQLALRARQDRLEPVEPGGQVDEDPLAAAEQSRIADEQGAGRSWSRAASRRGRGGGPKGAWSQRRGAAPGRRTGGVRRRTSASRRGSRYGGWRSWCPPSRSSWSSTSSTTTRPPRWLPTTGCPPTRLAPAWGPGSSDRR